ncbi:MAG: aminodeoxychorismate synthase component I [Deltaproteobacteria bacterium]|nr:aminodeoxychorismate synthase component I [Candidatus Anaeroferrophillacea bacterium]
MIVKQLSPVPDPRIVGRRLTAFPGAFWLDSGGYGGRLGRFSFLGADPFQRLEVGSRGTVIADCRTGTVTTAPRKEFFPRLEDILAARRRQKTTARLPFETGLVGWFGYELGHLIERFRQTTVNDLGLPDAVLHAYDLVLAIDHREGKAFIVSSGLPESGSARERRARERLAWMEELLAAPAPPPSSTPFTVAARPQSNFTHGDYLAAVGRILDYIRAGDIYQVNLSQRFTVPFTGSPWDFYLRFREVSPAPFGAFLADATHTVMSNSPERYLLIDGDYIETRPIKGTRPRGRTPAADEALKTELQNSGKDRAEHVMIVDLERNDLGRVARYGSVHVPEMEIIESYANVHHMVSTVAARVAAGRSTIDCVKNSFPGGSITGAPKIRSMEIIDELEPTCRGVYTGAIGYLDFSGDIDLNIAIRTAVHRDDRLHFQVGGGIVADSDPELEYEETLTKALSFLRALGAAE